MSGSSTGRANHSPSHGTMASRAGRVHFRNPVPLRGQIGSQGGLWSATPKALNAHSPVRGTARSVSAPDSPARRTHIDIDHRSSIRDLAWSGDVARRIHHASASSPDRARHHRRVCLSPRRGVAGRDDKRSRRVHRGMGSVRPIPNLRFYEVPERRDCRPATARGAVRQVAVTSRTCQIVRPGQGASNVWFC